MRLFLMSWETIGLNEKAVNSDLGLMEYTLKGFRPAFAEAATRRQV